MTALCLLGSTGSIGQSTLDVVARHPQRFRVVALSAGRNVERLVEQCVRFRPRWAVVADAHLQDRLRAELHRHRLETEALGGREALARIAADGAVDTVVAAIVGAAGLEPTLAAARSGKRVLLANKEALVMAGGLFLDAVRAGGATLIPLDSEHNAIFQCLPAGGRVGEASAGVRRILLTASGGPFRTRALSELDRVTPDEACRHPNWNMGRKISVDSATMMNKALEVIEACLLFDARPDQVEVVLHPQSIVHSLVEYIDGSIIGQLGHPDMRTPIAQALAWPERITSGVAPLDLPALGSLDFERPDPGRFPCLALAFAAARQGGSAPTVLNAANEVAVEAFLGGRLPFTGIHTVVARSLEAYAPGPAGSIDEIIAIDREARAVATARLSVGMR